MALSKVKACALAPLLLLAGCSAFFQFNLFKGLDKPPAPKASDYEGQGGLAKLANDLSSPAVVAQLKADPTTTQEIETYLATTYLSAPLTTPDQQQAAALYGDLNLKTTSGDQFVNNLVDIVMSGASGGKTIQQILQGIVPASVASDPTAFSNMVGGFLAAEAAYQLLGASVPPSPAGVNMGDVAQKAAVAWTMQLAVNAIIASGVPDTPTAEAQMYALLNNQPNSISGVIVPDPFSFPPAWLSNIFTAAGAKMPS
ncbi:MAG TPA: hypothetical protein VMU36_14165 [Spirochaetia bacterium]|nr:hypothetical protein [Spirochaetia bacterium]